MDEKSAISDERQWQLDARSFSRGVVWHWENLGTVIFGSGAVSFWTGMGHVITGAFFLVGANVCFVIACFRTWRSERRAKEKAIQPIVGTWTRSIYKGAKGEDILGILNLSFDGKILSGIFKESDIDHTINGSYNEKMRQFEGTVERVHRLAQEPRKFQEIIYWIIGNDTLLYYVPDNGFNEVEEGTFIRQNSKPLCGILAPWTRRLSSVPNK
jgi:hypothetical protein